MHATPLARAVEQRMERRLAAIAFLDVVGYSRLMGEDEEGTLREWAELRREVVEPRIRSWRGRVVDRAGDGVFVEFRSALEAFRWAVEVQDATGRRPPGRGGAMRLRIALHIGDVIDGPEGEVQGDGVNTAARLQAHAEPGGVILSRAVANEVQGKTGAVLADLGEFRLKNISRPVHAFGLRAAAVAARPAPRRARGMAAAAAAAAAAGAAVLLLVAAQRTPDGGAAPGPGAATTAAPAAASAPVPAPREEAARLLAQGRAVGCPEQPCPREWLAARAFYERAIAADPDYAPPYAEAAITHTNFVTSGLSLNEAEDRRAAERLATRAAALAPDQAFAHRARAAVLRLDPDRLEHALVAYLRALSLEPNQPVSRANAGWMLVLLGRPAEAEPFLRAALAVAPGHAYAPAWWTYLGLAELFLGREGHGAAHFRAALERQSQGAAAADAGLQRGLNLAAALALDGDLAAARLVAGEVRRQHPAVSTRTLWNCGCSREPGFRAGMDKLRQGVVLAGVPDTR